MGIYFWKRAPFIRLLIPFMVGIWLQECFHFPSSVVLLIALFAFLALALFFILPFFSRYRLSYIAGILASILLLAGGSWLTYKNDIRQSARWFGHSHKDSGFLLVKLQEPLVEKARSFKAEAAVEGLISQAGNTPATGSIILYFQKDSLLQLSCGAQLIIKKQLQEIRNTGNPGSFDYRRYCFFQGITHQVFLTKKDFILLKDKDPGWWIARIYSLRERILRILRDYIPGPQALGLAEALLIGYKDDLDKSLVQSYSSTGVVHIIAISGLHLGLIYWLLVRLFHPLKKQKKLKWLSPLLVIAGLWLFSLLAGAQPSVLRSALMFSVIVIAESIERKTSIYNSLALSAFVLLCYNPYWLWDAGFQLSYAAVISIVVFMRPVYHLLYIKNKWLDAIWKLNAVTLAAQVLTIPFTVYHFHQFPSYFLLANFLAVPLSSAILMGEILLCCLAFLPALAALLGKMLAWLITVMNSSVQIIEGLPFSVWNGMQVSVAQAAWLLLAIAGIAWWWTGKSVTGLKVGLMAILAFTILRSDSLIRAEGQQKIMVYNVPQKNAIDVIEGRHYVFTGDTSLEKDEFTRNFHLSPARTAFRASHTEKLDQLVRSGNFISWKNKRILLLDQTTSLLLSPQHPKTTIDLLILSGNTRYKLDDLLACMQITQVIFSGSVSGRKITQWKKDCDRLCIPWHDVTTNGAFAMNLR